LLWFFNADANYWTPSTAVFSTEDDADIALYIFNANSLLYLSPVDDPMFSAHVEKTRDYGFTHSKQLGDITVYAPDHITQFISCSEKVQLQNVRTGQQSQLSSLNSTLNSIKNLGFNDNQQATAHRLVEPFSLYMTSDLVSLQGPPALKSQQYVEGILSSGLPDNQWQQELKGWFDLSLAYHQASVVSYASKNFSASLPALELLSLNSLVSQMSDKTAESTCHNQMIRNSGQYQSFSMVGLLIIVTTGLVIVVISLCLQPLVDFCRRKFGSNQSFRGALWRTDFVLQQQRMVFEGGDLGNWTNTRELVPVTLKGEAFSAQTMTENVSRATSIAMDKSSIFTDNNSTFRYSENPAYMGAASERPLLRDMYSQ
jgi:hypothetical protein